MVCIYCCINNHLKYDLNLLSKESNKLDKVHINLQYYTFMEIVTSANKFNIFPNFPQIGLGLETQQITALSVLI